MTQSSPTVPRIYGTTNQGNQQSANLHKEYNSPLSVIARINRSTLDDQWKVVVSQKGTSQAQQTAMGSRSTERALVQSAPCKIRKEERTQIDQKMNHPTDMIDYPK